MSQTLEPSSRAPLRHTELKPALPSLATWVLGRITRPENGVCKAPRAWPPPGKAGCSRSPQLGEHGVSYTTQGDGHGAGKHSLPENH